MAVVLLGLRRDCLGKSRWEKILNLLALLACERSMKNVTNQKCRQVWVRNYKQAEGKK